MNRNYPAFILRDDSDFSVCFPDIPGCLTHASSIEDAFDAAREALEGHLASMVAEGMQLPKPTKLNEAVPDDEDASVCVATVLVPAVLPGRTVRTNITIDEGLLLNIDAVTTNRSAFFSEAARNELSRRRHGSVAGAL